MIFNLKRTGSQSTEFISQSDIIFGGTFLYTSNGSNWEAAFLTSGNLQFAKNPGLIDVFMCGPGQDGENGKANSESDVYGGNGGHGGEIVNGEATLVKNLNYPITVDGSNSSAFGLLARKGDTDIGAEPGTGGHVLGAAQVRTQPTGGTNGQKAFNGQDTGIFDLAGVLFGASGGGARCASLVQIGSDAYTHQPLYQAYPTNSGSIAGGKTGGGDGGGYKESGKNATANTGSGGGGGGDYGGISYQGGSGATGVVIIRNRRG